MSAQAFGSNLRPAGPSARTGAAAHAAKPSEAPASEEHEGEAFVQRT